ncbi:RNA-guided endonuclease IscB [Streptomyces sp. NPDC002994]|uniref:RNA-guided endonuclease IscB n=1 Tax=Streptomyces sp. NPDC002994 TaxID=3154441 RepID=UPI0033BC9FD0
MTTFDASEPTHPAVLPQRRALESAPADNPRSRDETGRGDHRQRADGTGFEHERGETPGGSTLPQERHPKAVSAPVAPKAEGVTAAREGGIVRTAGTGAAWVPVLDRDGIPLMPTHPARARKLLASGRAVVAKHTPFVIRLKDRTSAESEVTGVEVRIDPGSRATGIAITVDQNASRCSSVAAWVRRGLFAVELAHRGNHISKRMKQRALYRRRRRSANLRYRPQRSKNRARKSGWLPPSVQHRVDSTVSVVRRLARLFPVREVHVERVAFDTHALSAGRPLEGAEYQQGTLFGFEIREYLLAKWRRACAYCGAAGVPLQIEHIHPRARGGSDRVANLTLACRPCNQAKGAMPVAEFLADRPDRLARIQAQAKTGLRDAAAMNATRHKLFQALCELGVPVRAWSGGRTKYNRIRSGLAKTHTLDALCVGELTEAVVLVRHPDFVLVASATGRGVYARTTPDKFGFPRLLRPRQKQHYGFTTGDLVSACLSSGKYQGAHTGRVAVRATGRFNIRTALGLVQGVHHRHLRLLQRSDGYGYSRRLEGCVER